MLRTALLVACLASASAFAPPSGLSLRTSSPSAALSRARPSSMRKAPARVGPSMQVQELADSALLLSSVWPQGLVDGVTAYMNLYVPIFKGLNLPPFLLHWFHAMNMGFVLTAMGGYGTYLGWKIRDNNAVADVLAPGPAWANLGKTTGDLHKTLMGGMAVIFFLGANGGLVLSLVQNKPIMESAHFTTAMIGFTLLAMQAALTTRFQSENGSTARTTHAFLGSATMAVFFYHAFLGLQLGLEYSK